MANNVDEILKEVRGKEDKFKGYRHDGSKLDKFRSLVSKSLDPIEKLSNIVAQATVAVSQKLLPVHLLMTCVDIAIVFPSQYCNFYSS